MIKNSIQMKDTIIPKECENILNLVNRAGKQIPILDFDREIVDGLNGDKVVEHVCIRDMVVDDGPCPVSYIKVVDGIKLRTNMVIFIADPKELTERQAITAACYLFKKNINAANDMVFENCPFGYCDLINWESEAVERHGEILYGMDGHESNCIIYTGFSTSEELYRQLQIVSVYRDQFYDSGFCALIMAPEVFETQEVRVFCMEESPYVIRLPKPEPSEAGEILRYIFRDTDVTVVDKLWGRVARAIKRLYGNDYSERTLLYHSRKAAKRADNTCRKILTYEDFLGQPEENSVSDELAHMTGLDSLKCQMREFEALLEETIRNPRLEDVHRHMIIRKKQKNIEKAADELVDKSRLGTKELRKLLKVK